MATSFRIYLFISIVATVALFIVSLSPVYAAESIVTNLEQVAGDKQVNLKKFGGDIPTAIGQVIGAALALVGIVFFLLTIYGGVLWMTAHVNDEQVSKGMHTVIAAAIGLVIVLSAYVLVRFVFGSIEGKQTRSDTTNPPGYLYGPPVPVPADLSGKMCANLSSVGNVDCGGFSRDACITLDKCRWDLQTTSCIVNTGFNCLSLPPDECEDTGAGYCHLVDAVQINCPTPASCVDVNVCGVVRIGTFTCSSGQVCCDQRVPVQQSPTAGQCEDVAPLPRGFGNVACPGKRSQPECDTARPCCRWVSS